MKEAPPKGGASARRGGLKEKEIGTRGKKGWVIEARRGTRKGETASEGTGSGSKGKKRSWAPSRTEEILGGKVNVGKREEKGNKSIRTGEKLEKPEKTRKYPRCRL